VIYSTVTDMALWIKFNMNHGFVRGRQLIRPETLAQIHSPQMVIGADSAAPTPGATYGLGWIVDAHSGLHRISHGGNLHDVTSEVAFFPSCKLGFVAFSNLGAPSISRLIYLHALSLLVGCPAGETLAERLALYESRIEETRQRNAAVTRVSSTSPSHVLDEYTGAYRHPGYGEITIERDGAHLMLRRHTLALVLEHWHYDAWVAADNDTFVIHSAHAFDKVSRLLFQTDADGKIESLSIRLEAAVSPIHFSKVAS